MRVPGTREILAARGPKAAVDPQRPYGFFIERERSADGRIVDVAVVLLTNRECPWKCLMCDLWRHTLDERTPLGAIPAQLDYALERLPPAEQIKLYNAGNFFDPQAIPAEDHAAIAARLQPFARVIVENHPRLCGPRVLDFQQRLGKPLEVALGLETVHPEVLPRLNKGMTVEDYDRAVRFLVREGVDVRTFLLLRPPYLSEDEGIAWALRSLAHAFAQGSAAASVIPTRPGNGALDALLAEGLFTPPRLASLSRVLERALAEYAPGRRVWADLWEARRFAACGDCAERQLARLEQMNLEQRVLPGVACAECDFDGV